MKKRNPIIENNEPNLYFLTFIVEKYGYEVRASPDGKESLELAYQIKLDLVYDACTGRTGGNIS
jgi:CheY-like chemotaxis protein